MEQGASKIVQQQTTLVVGLGQSGLSCVRFLVAQGVPVAVTDSRQEPPGLAQLHHDYPNVPVFVGGFDRDAFAAASRLVVSPGVSLVEPLIQQAIARGAKISGDVALFAEYAAAPIVAITGSNGKSTVTTLLTEMIKAAGRKVLMGGNIGIPALDLLVQPIPELYVLELSSFQLETATQLNAAVATVLNISEDHMDRYDDLAHYSEAKRAVFNGAGMQVLNRDDARVLNMADSTLKQHWFSLSVPAEGEYGLRVSDGVSWLAFGDERLIETADICMAGRHNYANALAALAMCDALGLARSAMLDTLRNFGGLSHRCQYVARQSGVAWYNDSKATNVGATLAAVNGFDEKLILLAGGQGKGADFAPLADAADKLAAVIYFGEDGEQIAKVMSDKVACYRADSLSSAVEQAAAIARSGESVLLSPACASFDMFKGFEDRGEQFIELVRGRQHG